MKKLIWSVAMLVATISFNPVHVQAQFRISLGLNIGTQPDWGPEGYDHAEFYYMPDIGVYYDVPNRQYVYPNGGGWARATVLPPQYHNYDLYHGYKVVINKPNPYLHDNVYRSQYAQYRGRHDQVVIRDSHDHRYDQYHQQHAHDHDHDRDHRDDHRDDHHDDHH